MRTINKAQQFDKNAISALAFLPLGILLFIISIPVASSSEALTCKQLGKLAAYSPDCQDGTIKNSNQQSTQSTSTFPSRLHVSVVSVDASNYGGRGCRIKVAMFNDYKYFLNSFGLDAIAIGASGTDIGVNWAYFSNIEAGKFDTNTYDFATPCNRIAALKVIPRTGGCTLNDDIKIDVYGKPSAVFNNQLLGCSDLLNVTTIQGKLPLRKEPSAVESIRKELMR
jgi:hypothetical protein